MSGAVGTFRAIGTRAAPKAERGPDFYETPDVAVAALLAVEQFDPLVLEPCCGHGAISTILEAQGHRVVLNDLIDRGCASAHGEQQHVGDFLAAKPRDLGLVPHCFDIVTNPPFGIANAFVRHALQTFRPGKAAFLLNLNFMCGAADPDRLYCMEENPPARIHVFSRRLPMMHRDGWTGPKSGSQMNTAWFVWDVFAQSSAPALHRLDWKRLQAAERAA